MGGALVELIAESLKSVTPEFDSREFQYRALKGLETLELMDRALHIAHAMAGQLPANFDSLAEILIESLGPPLTATQGNGLGGFFYLPHSQLIATYGPAKFTSGMRANRELTCRFTAEFSIRPFLARYPQRCLKWLSTWARDENAHVRRLVSEGTRSRLPWAAQLVLTREDPQYSLQFLEILKDDPESYVRRSVANHLGDIAKDHPDIALDVCQKWLGEIDGSDDPLLAKNRRWLIRHALRHPARKAVPEALKLRKAAADIREQKR